MPATVLRSVPVLAIALFLAATANPTRGATSAPGTDIDHIGIYLDAAATDCDVALGAGESVTLEVLAVLPTLGDGGLTAIEFRVADLPVNGTGGTYTTEWNTELVLGEVASGIALAFSDPLFGEVIPIGRITFHAFADDWLGADRALHVAESTGGPKLVIVDGDYQEHFVPGSYFTFNCSDPDACACDAFFYPGCLLLPPAFDFGFVWIGDSAQHRFTIVNYTADTVQGAAIAPCEHFALVGGEGDFTLLPGQSWVVTVRYEPQGLGQHDCVIELGSELCAGIHCTGHSLPPPTVCELSTDHLDFGAVEVGQAANRTVTITNAGDEILAVTMGEDCPHFEVWNAGFFVLEPGQSRVVTLTFRPTEAGEHICLVQTNIAGENDCGPIECVGTAFNHVPNCAVEPALLDFGDVPAGAHVDRAFTIRNLGDAQLTGNVNISGLGFSLVQGGGSFTLAPGDALQGVARFTYICPDDFEGTLTTGLTDCSSIPCVAHGLSRDPRTYTTVGLYADPGGYDCFADLPPYTPTTVYIMAYVSADLLGIRGAQFSVDHLPNSSCAVWTPYWTTEHVTGNLAAGITLTYDEVQPGPWIVLGEVEFYETQPGCIGDNYEMEVGGAILVDECFDGHYAQEGHFTFNCVWGCDCFWTTPVSLSQFAVEDLGAAARVRWESANSDEGVFRLEAALDGTQWVVPYEQPLPAHYEALDEAPALAGGGLVTYRLYGRLDGEDWTLLRSETLAVSPARRETRLLAPHPNPANPAVTIPYSLATTGRVTLAVYDLAGRRVALLINGVAERGEQSLLWRGRDDAGRLLPSGVYFVGMEARGFSARQKLVLIR